MKCMIMMYNTEKNKDHIHILDNLSDYRQPHQHINLNEKKTVL